MVEKPVSILEYLPLPYDDELGEAKDTGEDAKAYYDRVTQSDWFNSDWWNKK